MTHHHLAAVINTLLRGQSTPGVIRILDMGCGDGQLIAFLQKKLCELRDDLEFELYGFDVSDSHIQVQDYFDRTLNFLREQSPQVDWERRIHRIDSTHEWPFESGFFDFVISNQVMEHVLDHNFSFQQIWRVLKEHGMSIHLFPLKSYILEGHLLLPFVHWISNADLLFAYIKLCSQLGLGKYKKLVPQGTSASLIQFSRQHADFMIYETNYLTAREVYQFAKHNRMRCSFRFTEEYYLNKMRQVLGEPIKYEYATLRNALWERIFFAFCVRLASVTLVLDKQNTYR